MKFSFEVKAIFAKPCPFCGSENVVTESKSNFYARGLRACSYIKCADCGAAIYSDPVRGEDGEFIGTYNSAQHMALEMWNRRSA